MKYINADKLIAEIRKLRSESCISESDDYYEYAKSEIIDIITSLQRELPNGLDEAAKKYRDYREECGIKDPVMLDEIEEAHYAGAEWGTIHFNERKEDEK